MLVDVMLRYKGAEYLLLVARSRRAATLLAVTIPVTRIDEAQRSALVSEIAGMTWLPEADTLEDVKSVEERIARTIEDLAVFNGC